MNKPLSRRTVLKGVGATLALPLLDAMAPQAKAAAPAAASPKRLAFFYIPNGVIRDGWFPEKTDAHYELPSTLRPLADFKQDTLIVSGLDRTFASGSDVHAQCGCCWLTSSPPTERLDGNLPINTTLDQVIASQVGGRSVFPSLELSCNSFTNTRESKSFDAISWYAPGHAAESERNPQKLFRRMLGKDAKIDRSALDILREDARDLHRTLGRADQRKLDEYLESVRAIEQQLKRIAASRDQAKDLKIDMPAETPVDRGEYIRLMGDLVVLAFQADRTRIVTNMIGPERWQTPQLYHGVFDKPKVHHAMTHAKDKDKQVKDEVRMIDHFHVEQFAYVVRKMKSIREGEQSLLDNSMLVLGSGLGDGGSHTYKELPLLIAGSGGGSIRGGRHVKHPKGTPLANLWLSLANTMGVKLPRFADSTGALSGLV